MQIDYKALSMYSLSVSPKLKDALSLSLIVRRKIMCAEKVTKYNVCSLTCVLLYTRGHSLVSMVMYLSYLAISHIDENLL